MNQIDVISHAFIALMITIMVFGIFAYLLVDWYQISYDEAFIVSGIATAGVCGISGYLAFGDLLFSKNKKGSI